MNSPNSALIISLVWKQKRHGSFLLSPIPDLRPSHCPLSRISNAASPRQVNLYMNRPLSANSMITVGI